MAVTDPLPLFRAGVGAVLAAEGHDVESPVDLIEWLQQGSRRILVITLASESDWALLVQVGRLAGEFSVVALLIDSLPSAGARAVHAGAHSVLNRDSSARDLILAVSAAEKGIAVLPEGVVQDLRVPQGNEVSLGPTPAQLSWLRALAGGSTVTALAEQAGYSERAMYRMLRRLYAQLGVRTRTEALMRAQAAGWLTAGRRGG